MKLETLYVSHFRHLQSHEISFTEVLNEIIGDNAQGKTSVLEALHMLILGSSFRTHQLRELIRHGESELFVEARVDLGGVIKTVSLRYDGKKRSVSIDGQLQESSSLLFGNILGVTATLEDQDLIFGSPSVRRRFLDEQIAQIDPFYVQQMSRYARALAQRNKLLKERQFHTIEAWEEQLAIAGAYIVAQRKRTVDLLNPHVVEAYQRFFGVSDGFSMKYIAQGPHREGDDFVSWCQEQYRSRRSHEVRVGSTLVGPHRDDVDWSIQEKPCKVVASLGQARAVALALRYAEWNLLAQRSRQTPLFLIDDIESALDSRRTKILVELCENFGQVFLTGHERHSSTGRIVQVLNGVCFGS